MSEFSHSAPPQGMRYFFLACFEREVLVLALFALLLLFDPSMPAIGFATSLSTFRATFLAADFTVRVAFLATDFTDCVALFCFLAAAMAALLWKT